jgi:integrase
MTNLIDSKAKRAKLEPRREPYFERIKVGLYVGYRQLESGEGRWIARRRIDGKQLYHGLGTLESYDQAVRLAGAWSDTLDAGVQHDRTTVSQACEQYVEHLRSHRGKRSADDAKGRFERLIYKATIGGIDLAKLRTPDLNRWFHGQVKTFSDEAEDEDDADALRRSKDSANRNLASLKAALNQAYKNRLVASDAAWKTVDKFKDVGRRRPLFLDQTQRVRLLESCDLGLRRFVTALLLTGARPGELANLSVKHFDSKQGTLALHGKTGFRVVTLFSSTITFFEAQTKDKIANALIFADEWGHRWTKDSWKKPFKAAVRGAGLPPEVVMYSIRHAAISEMIAAGMNSSVVAKLAGTSTQMIDKHYGHLNHDQVRAKFDSVATALLAGAADQT